MKYLTAILVLALSSLTMAQQHIPSYTLDEDVIIFDADVVEITPPGIYFQFGTGINNPGVVDPMVKSLTDATEPDVTKRLRMKLDYGISYTIKMIGFPETAENPNRAQQTVTILLELNDAQKLIQAWLDLGIALATIRTLGDDFETLFNALNTAQ